MPQAGTQADANKTADPNAGKGAEKVKEPKAPKEKKAPSVNRSNFSTTYPENAKVEVLVKENPKKQGSKSRERFDHYFKASTVGDFLAAGGTYQDIAYDVGRQFIKVTPV